VELEIGRVVKNICFSGKGYVDKPANPDSIIFSNSDGFSFANVEKITEFTDSNQSGVQYDDDEISHSLENDFIGELNMSDLLKEQNVELKASNDALKAQLKELEEKVSKANIEKFESTISELETNIEDLAAKLKDSVDKTESVEKELDETKVSLEEALKVKSELEETISVMNQEKVTSGRISMLVEAGFEKSDAEAKVELFSNLNDEQFKAVSDEIVKALKVEDVTKESEEPEVETASEEVEEDKEGEETAESSDLEDAEPEEEEVDLSKASNDTEETDEVANLQVDLVKAFASALNVDLDDTEIKDSLS